MFFNNISMAIEAIGTRKFENDKIDIKLNDNANFFLKEIERFSGSLIPHDVFKRLYVEKRYPGQLATLVRGLSLKKTDVTSKRDDVNPEFLTALKKTTQAYLIALASNWRICSDVTQINKETVVKVIKEYEEMGATHCVLNDIAANRNFRKKIIILGTTDGTYMEAKWKHLKSFLDILREESMGCRPLSLTQLACRHICYDLATSKIIKDFGNLPVGLPERIKEEEIFCLKKC